MLRFSINASMMLTEHAFLDRFAAAADLGFAGVDLQFPYDHPSSEIAARAAAAGVEIVLVNVPAGDLVEGGNGLACVPGREKEFAQALEKTKSYVAELGCRRVNVLAGRLPEDADPERARETLVANLRRAVDVLGPLGVTVMVEPVNGRDVPRFFIRRTSEALGVIAEARGEGLGVQFDFYHRQIVEGDLIAGFEAALPKIAHLQFADTPGRHEPGTGEINFASVFDAVERSDYDGWIGAEYRPSTTTADSLAWFRDPRSGA